MSFQEMQNEIDHHQTRIKRTLPPVEFNSAKEVVDALHGWASKHPDDHFPGTRSKYGAPSPPKVTYQEEVIQTIEFTVALNRVRWLIPCKNGKYLFVKPFPGRKKGLTTWVGDSHGFGTDAMVSCDTPGLGFPEPTSTASGQSIDTPINHNNTVNSEIRSSSGRLLRTEKK